MINDVDPSQLSDDDVQQLIGAGIAPEKIAALKAQMSNNQDTIGAPVNGRYVSNGRIYRAPTALNAISTILQKGMAGRQNRQDQQKIQDLQDQQVAARNTYARAVLGRNNAAINQQRDVANETQGAATMPMGGDPSQDPTQSMQPPEMPPIQGNTTDVQNALTASLRKKKKASTAGQPFPSFDPNEDQTPTLTNLMGGNPLGGN
jgi:hypothetical protein